MRTASWPKPVREPLEVHLIYRIEDGRHPLLDNFVFLTGDTQRPLPAVGLRNVDSP
jgi:hypothetical protein